MTIATTRLGIAKPTTADDFSTDEIADNWDLVDAHPGVFICTSGSRPSTWGVNHEGMLIYETNRDLYWRWDGAAFVRAWPVGWLNGSRRTADLSVASTTPTTLVSAAVSVPAGGRRVHVAVAWGGIENSVGVTALSLYRDEVALTTWKVHGNSVSTDPDEDDTGGGLSYYEAPGEGAFTYSLRMASVVGIDGTSYCRASATSPTSIDVSEV